jgi:crotonobetainyl-CoA:carnitine CoA-transferase CaiB-like acyl-CoA transferase
VLGYEHVQNGNGSVSRKPTASRFRCGSGYIVLAVLTERQFGNLMKTLGREDVLADSRFADWTRRIEHAQALREVIEAAMVEGDPKGWESRFTAADVPCATVHSISEIVNHPQVAHRELLQEAATPFGPVRLAGAGFRFEHGSGGIDKPMAMPGEHTDAVLGSVGYDAAQIAQLRAEQVI